MRKIISGLIAGAIMLIMAGATYAATIDVLWYGGALSYNNKALTLAGTGAGSASAFDPLGDGSLTWNMTIWNPEDTISFDGYDVLVIGATSVFGTGMDPTRLLSSKAAIEAARGSRTFLSGQDADWHFNNAPQDPAKAFIVNAVNWAASGSGLGIVSMADGWTGSGSQWWLNENSFLKDELSGYVQYFQNESVIIPSGMESFPINEGLTTNSLSNWLVSSHAGFSKEIPGYTSINDAGTGGLAVTIVTKGLEDGGTDGGNDNPVVPEPSTALLLGIGLLGTTLAGRRMRRK